MPRQASTCRIHPKPRVKSLAELGPGIGLVGSAMGLGRVKTVRPRETGDAKLNLACCRTCELDSTWFARSTVSDLVAPMRTPHVWIAAMSGFTPRMFMTRVRL